MDKVYVPSNATNIIDTWRRFGYVPPSEQEYYQKRWEYYQSLPLKKNPAEAGNGGKPRGDNETVMESRWIVNIAG